MTATIKTAATSKQVREPTQELSEDELNAVAGGQNSQGGQKDPAQMGFAQVLQQTMQSQG